MAELYHLHLKGRHDEKWKEKKELNITPDFTNRLGKRINEFNDCTINPELQIISNIINCLAAICPRDNLLYCLFLITYRIAYYPVLKKVYKRTVTFMQPKVYRTMQQAGPVACDGRDCPENRGC